MVITARKINLLPAILEHNLAGSRQILADGTNGVAVDNTGFGDPLKGGGHDLL